MFFKRRIISALDKARLLDAVDRERSSWTSYAPCLDYFRRELARTPALEAADVPPDVITMGTRFALADVPPGERDAYTLAYPGEEDRRAVVVEARLPKPANGAP